MKKKELIEENRSLKSILSSVDASNQGLHVRIRNMDEQLTNCQLEKNALRSDNDRLQRLNNDNNRTT